MTQQTAASASGKYGPPERAIRAQLLACPGSALCNAGGCDVITQGGQRGADDHRHVVHPELTWYHP